MTFAAAAARLAGFAGATLGWQPDAFWCATPAELTQVVRAKRPPVRRGSPPT